MEINDKVLEAVIVLLHRLGKYEACTALYNAYKEMQGDVYLIEKPTTNLTLV